MDGPNIQHFLDMDPHIIVHMGRYASIPLLKRGLIGEPDFMFNQSSFNPDLGHFAQTGAPI